MSLFSTILEVAPKPIATFLTSTPTQYLISYTLQSIFFSLAITSVLTALLKLIHFSYAKIIFNNSITKIALSILFMYIKIWKQSSWFVVVGYACGAFVALYVYDCGMNIAQAYVENVQGWYWYQVAAYVLFAMVLPLVLIQVFVKSYSLPLYICLMVQILVIATRTALKNKHIIFSAIPSLVILTIPLIRHLRSLNLYTQNIPLQTIPLIMMAFDAQFRQHKKVQAAKIKNANTQQAGKQNPETQQKQSIIFELLKTCVCFLLYICFNGDDIYLEHLVGGIWAIVQLVKFK